MIRDLVMPQLGMGMSSGTIVEWAIAEGGRVARDQSLLSVETEKVVTDVPSLCDGILHIVAPAGTSVPIDVLIARVAETEAEYRSLVGGPAPAANTAAAVFVGVTAAPQPAAATGRIRVSGLARKLARDAGVDLAGVTGSGPGGRIVKRDLLALTSAVASAPPAAPAAPPQPAPQRLSAAPVRAPSQAGIREKSRIPVSGMRRAIAEKMAASSSVAAHTFLFFEIDVSKLTAARQTMLARAGELGTRVSLTALYTRALALACRQVPICNAAMMGDEIILWDEVNVGIGVAIPGRAEHESGLMVPVVRNAEAKGLLEIDSDIRELVARTRAGKLTARDVGDATVTLSSTERLNSGGWMVGTALLTLPQVLAFSPGKPVRKPVVAADGQIVAGDVLPCCITFDHRALDGEPATRLAKHLTDMLGHPELMLL